MSLPPATAETDALIQRVRAGETAAFAGIVAGHQRELRAFLCMKLPQTHLVDDVAQDAFIYAYQNLTEYTPGTSFGAWLRAVAWNCARTRMQRHARETGYLERYQRELETTMPHTNDTAEASDTAEHLRDCLTRVPAGMARLVRMYYAEEERCDTIAAALGRSLSWVQVNLHRTRAALRECLNRKLQLTAS